MNSWLSAMTTHVKELRSQTIVNGVRNRRSENKLLSIRINMAINGIDVR